MRTRNTPAREGETFSVAIGLLSDTPIQIAVRDSKLKESPTKAASMFILLMAAVNVMVRRATRAALVYERNVSIK